MNSIIMVGPMLEPFHYVNSSHISIKLEQKDESHARPSDRSSREFDTRDLKNGGIKLEFNDELCRVCLKQGEIAIHGKNRSEDLSVAISTFGGVEISPVDPYPKSLCNSCNELLQGAILFRKTAQDTDACLRNAPKPEPEMSQVQYTFQAVLCKETNVDKLDEATESTEDKFTVTSVSNPIEIDSVNDSKQTVPGHKTKKRSCLNSRQENKPKRKKRPKSDHITKKIMPAKSPHNKMERITCPVCKKSLARNYYSTHKKIHESPTTYVCDICGKEVRQLGALEQHRLTHFYDLPLKCSFCPYRGRNKCLLTMHMRSHTGERPYICEQCPQRFISKSNLNRHMRTHTKEHKFKCDCGKSYYDKRHLEDHIKAEHMGIKEHVCQICGNAYGCRSVLRKHERRVHKREKLRAGIKPVYLKLETLKQQEGSPLVSE